MHLRTAQKDRAAGVLLGGAIGDALGVPYEFASPIAVGEAYMAGGGLGPYSPGEWSDDTQMAVCIAEVSATGADLTSRAALDKIAQRFIEWRYRGASDIGHQTEAVITGADRMISGSAMDASMSRYDLELWSKAFQVVSADYAASHSRSAGNGGLMRNGVVGLTRLDDRSATAVSARAIAALTHSDPLVAASCVLHAEAVRVAVTEARLDIRGGLDLLSPGEREQWAAWIDEAEGNDPSTFRNNGFTVIALQAAWSAIHHTRTAEPTPDHVNAALQVAISIGHDTDTVAAIAGALLGARYGVSGLRHEWRQQVHGWPRQDGRGLIQLGLRTASAGVGQPLTAKDWPLAQSTCVEESRLGVPLPADPTVVLGTEADLARAAELRCETVVSLSRLGTDERCPLGVTTHFEQWLVDSEDPTTNGNLVWALHDAADAVHTAREIAAAHGHRVLLHCVRAEHRTPAVALMYAVKHCHQSPDEAMCDILNALHREKIDGLLWRTALEQSWELTAESELRVSPEDNRS